MKELWKDLPDAEAYSRLTMNDPFCYDPHPLCLKAVQLFKPSIDVLMEGEQEGKMFGVLVVENTSFPNCEGDRDETARGEAKCRYGCLAAYSGQIRGRSDWPGFVPAVFDYLQPDGYFKQHEAEITALTQQIVALEQQPERLTIAQLLASTRQLALETAVRLNKENMEARQRRREIRAAGPLSKDMEDALIRESQFMKAETRRIKKSFTEQIDRLKAKMESFDEPIRTMKKQRRELSDSLQHWLFEQFAMLNDQGQHRNLNEIFSNTSLGRPPSGAGECCEPKLLQYAYTHGWRPMQMAMFWVGASPKVEIRHNGRFYPACRGKCLPILRWMITKKEEKETPPTYPELPIIYEDEDIVVVIKPAGLLSVPGISEYYSVWSIMRHRYPDTDSSLVVHRLDQPTSGLMLIGKTRKAMGNLQRQFERRIVKKRYVALLENDLSSFEGKETTGVIDLPLYSDPLNRPFQSVDANLGKRAVTEYEVLGQTNGHTRIALSPRTGRTHQLRVHCAHQDGLDNPILGDALYGRHSAPRLYLHAERISFLHPRTGEELSFSAPAPF